MAKKNIFIASLSPKLYTTERLLSEGKKIYQKVNYLNPYQFHLLYKNKPKVLSEENLYFHRTTGTNYDDFDLLVTKHHEHLGFKTTNPASALATFRSKDFQAQFFIAHNIASIPSLIYRGEINERLLSEVHELGRKEQKYILKMNRGNQGIGVNYIESQKSLLSLLETFHAIKDQRFLIQPYISHKKEWRLFIIKNEIVAAVEKTLSHNDFRGNAKRSKGKILKKIPGEIKDLAISAFRESKLDYAGIDLLLSDEGQYMILEINPVPGFEQLEELSGINIARELIVQLQ